MNDLSRTLALANRYLMLRLDKTGLEGLAPSHGDILVELFDGGEVSMSEISRRIARDPSTVTALVKKLVSTGLAETRKGDSDRRTTTVRLTEQGRALKGEFAEISERLRATWREGVDEEDLSATYRVLEAVQGNLRAAIDEMQGFRSNTA